MVDTRSGRYRILFVTRDDANVSLLRQGLLATTVASFEVDGARDLAGALMNINHWHPDLILYDLQIGGGCDVAGVEELVRKHSAIPLVVMTDEQHEAEAGRVLELGCEDVFVKGWAVDGGASHWRDAVGHGSADPILKGVTDGNVLVRELLHAIHRHRAHLHVVEEPPKSKAQAKGVISFIGSKGGVGTTTTALSVATLIDPDPSNVIMVEVDPMRAVLPAMLRLTNGRSLADLIEPDRLKTECLDETISSVEGGPFILTGRTEPPRATSLTDHADSLVQVMRSVYPFVVLDVVLDPRGDVRKFLEASDIICLVLEPEPVSASSAQWMLRMFAEWGIPEEKVCVLPVFSRPGSVTGVKMPQLSRFLKKKLMGLIPYAGDDCAGAVGDKVPVTRYRPDSALTEALRELAEGLRKKLETTPSTMHSTEVTESLAC